jgi:hypothetical protein
MTTDAGGTGDGPAAAGSAEGACAAFASAYCAQFASCFPVDFKAAAYGTDATCLSGVAARCVDEFTAPGSSWTIPQRMACTSALTTCDAIGWNAPAVCVPAGTLALGAPCVYGTQCKSARCGGAATSGACGTCQTASALDAGCDPTQPQNPCAQGLVCGTICQAPSAQGGPCPSAATDQCVAPTAQGGACSDTSDCATGLTCIGQKCVPKRPIGQPCAWSPDCAGDALCVSGQCATATYGTTGMTCSTTVPGGPLCFAQDLCVGGSANKCYQRIGDGGMCMSTQECSPGLTCAGGACQFVMASSCH